MTESIAWGTASSVWIASELAVTVIVLSMGECFIAFVIRFMNTCYRRFLSPTILCSINLLKLHAILTFLLIDWNFTNWIISFKTLPTTKWSFFFWMSPLLRRVRSSMSFIFSYMNRADALIYLRMFIFSLGGISDLLVMRSTKIAMQESGVIKSWLTACYNIFIILLLWVSAESCMLVETSLKLSIVHFWPLKRILCRLTVT